MGIYREDLVDIELESGTIHRSFLNHSIGKGDNMGNRFGVRLFRNGEAIILGSGCSCEGFFMAPNGQNIMITGSGRTYANGNVAWVQLPQACYNYEGQFTLAIKVIDTGNGVTGTMRIVDGIVDNTGTDGAVAPVGTVPTYQEILAVYDQMIAAKDYAVRYDIVQDLTSAQKAQARQNIDLDGAVLYDRDQNLTSAQKAQARDNIKALHDATFYALGLYLDSSGYVCQKLEDEPDEE